MANNNLLTEAAFRILNEDSTFVLLENSTSLTVVPAPLYRGGVPIQSIQDILLGDSAQITRRCEILNFNGTIWRDDVALVSGGSISVDIARDERRNLDITLANLDDDLPLGQGYLWYDKLIRPWRGVDAGPLGQWEIPLGTFMIDKIDRTSKEKTVKITGRDLSKKLILSKTDVPIMFVAGTDALAIVAAESALAGVNQMVIPVGIPLPLAADITFDTGTSRMDMVKQVLTPFGFEAFMDPYGFLIVRPWRDPFTTASRFTFKTGSNGNIVSFSKSIGDNLLYNKVVVTAESEATIPATGSATVTDTSSPLHANTIGDRPFFYKTSLVTTNQDCVTLATSLLKAYALEQFSASVDSIAIPWLDGGDIVDFIDPEPQYSGEPTRFLLQNFRMGLDIGPMSFNVGRVLTLL